MRLIISRVIPTSKTIKVTAKNTLYSDNFVAFNSLEYKFIIFFNKFK
jgi:hypothetical protein